MVESLRTVVMCCGAVNPVCVRIVGLGACSNTHGGPVDLRALCHR
jgi:hypothetical protein